MVIVPDILWILSLFSVKIMDMDKIDYALLALLQEDAARPCAELGGLVGLSASSVNDRLHKLRARGVIRRHTVEADPAALGLDLLAYVLVVVAGNEIAFREAMRDCSEVLECHHVTGEFSYLLKLRLENTGALERFLAERLKPLEAIGRTHTLITLSSVKETHVLHLPVPTASKT